MARRDMLKPQGLLGESLRKEAARWIERIEQAGKDEKTWMDDADEATRVFTGEREPDTKTETVNGLDFNILFSNVETIVPAIINSPPAPDIRRRFGQDDPIARDYAEIQERTIRVQVDDGKLQTEMEGMAQDGFLAGRGLIRLRFKSDIQGVQKDELEAPLDEAEAEIALDSANKEVAEEAAADIIERAVAPVERVTNERICFEAVSWRDFRRGPAKRWDDVPWQAFRHSVQPEEFQGFADNTFLNAQPRGNGEKEPIDYTVWEVWDKKSRTVIFVEEGEKRIIKRVPDPLGLTKFFPTHDPVQAITVNGRLMPVNPYSIYKKLAEELNTTTRRIRRITNQLKVKGWYATSPENIQSVVDADDNEFVPLDNPELWAAKGGVDGAIAFWPVEKLVQVLQGLYQLRDQTKQAIYEITGISDIVRGASRVSETATAQQIKTQWGSLRIQKMQRAMERAARDLFVMMAEIIASKFTPETLEKITGIQMVPTEADLTPVPLPPPTGEEEDQQLQAKAEAAEQERQAKLARLMQLSAMMQENVTTFYRIDVESDSTVKADLTRQKSEATEFMQAASAYFTAVAPLVQQGALPLNIAVEIFGSFARLFNLGKSVEDALDELIEKAKTAAGQPSEPSPQERAAQQDQQAQAEHSTRMRELEAASKQAENDDKAEKAAIDIRTAAVALEAREMDLGIKRNDLAVSNMKVRLQQEELKRALGPLALPPLGGGDFPMNGMA